MSTDPPGVSRYPLPAPNETDVLTAPPFDSALIRDGVGAEPGLRFSRNMRPMGDRAKALTATLTSAPVVDFPRISPSTASPTDPPATDTCSESGPPPGLVATSETLASPPASYWRPTISPKTSRPAVDPLTASCRATWVRITGGGTGPSALASTVTSPPPAECPSAVALTE